MVLTVVPFLFFFSIPKNIQKPLKSVEKASNIQFQALAHLREISRHWRNSLRIYNILSKIETSYSKGFSRDNLLKILKEYNIVLQNLARIKPLKDTGVLKYKEDIILIPSFS